MPVLFPLPALVTYGGINLPNTTPEATDWVEDNISVRQVMEFQRWAWPGVNRTKWAFPGHVTDRPVRLGSLYWPTGATRWAIAHFLVTDDQWGPIKTAAYQGGVYRELNLVMADGQNSGTEIHPLMWLLPSRFEVKIPGANGLYLMTLVDDRYFWQVRSTKSLVITELATTWYDLYSQASAALGLQDAIIVDTIPTTYLTPGKCLQSLWEQTGLFLDAVAYNCGQRIVRELDGSVRAMNVTNSQARVAFNLGKNPSATGAPVKAGGVMLLPPPSTSFPGFPFINDSPGVLPESVTFTSHIVQGRLDTGFLYDLIVPLTDLVTAGLLPEFAAAKTEAGNSKVFHDSIGAVFDGVTPLPFNQSVLLALAKQVATDWYRYQVSPLDIKFAGIAPWLPEGWSDAIEWLWRKDEVSTRVQRGTWNDLVEELCHGKSPPPAPAPGPPITININIDIVNIQKYYNVIIFEGFLYINLYNCCLVWACGGIVYCLCGQMCGVRPYCVACCGCVNGICSKFVVTLASIAGGACCAFANGSWIMEIDPANPCHWLGSIPPGPGCTGPSTLAMFCSTSQVQVRITGSLGSFATYISAGPINCTGSTTLNIGLTGGPPDVPACTWPATISIAPADDCPPCGSGSGSGSGSGGPSPGPCGTGCCKCADICTFWDVTIATNKSGTAPPPSACPTDRCCEDINGTWTVTQNGIPCHWELSPAGVIPGADNCPGGWDINMVCSPGGGATVTIGKIGSCSQLAQYSGPILNCTGQNILYYDGVGGGYPPCEWPKTITVQPNGRCGDCGPGSGGGSGSGSSGSGSGSSGSGGSDLISTPCCSSPVPATLFVSLTGDGCADFPVGPVTIFNGSGNPSGPWEGSAANATGGFTTLVRLICVGGNWFLEILGTCCGSLTIGSPTGICAPVMELTFQGTGDFRGPTAGCPGICAVNWVWQAVVTQ